MFGSKLRSWMENHIVRSRKKGNRNKNSQAVEAAANADPQQQHKLKHAATGFTIYHHHTSSNSNGSCSSPYKTSSNSQASSANHTGGCSSVISSPNRRREVSPIQNHAQSRYGWQSPDRENVISPKSENFLYAPHHHHSQQYLRSHHTAPNTRENSCEEKPYNSQQQQQQQQQPQQQQHQLNCSTSSFSSLSWSTGSKEPSMHSNVNGHSLNNATTNGYCSTDAPISACTPEEEEKLSDSDPNAVHYEEIGTLIRHPEKLLQNILNEIERPKSEQLPYATQRVAAFSDEKQTQDDASTRYGRLLPSKIPNPTIISFRTGSEECIPRNGSGAPGHNAAYLQPRSGPRKQLRNGGPGNTSVPLVSLSSPESAYSTGYSTDGTSPGAGYTPPEYYVNMRTGTHYFPKSVNSLAIEAQRYKFGLNKIEEMSPIDPLPKTSFAQRNCDEPDNGLLRRSHVVEPYDKTTSQFQPWAPTSGSQSPLPIRNTIVLPTLKGFESPSPRQRSRIRTNPWYSTTETSSSSSTMQAGQQLLLLSGGGGGGEGTPMHASHMSTMTISSTSSHSTSALSTIHLEQEFQRTTPSSIKSSRNYTSGSSGGVNTSQRTTAAATATNTNANSNNNSNKNNNNKKLASSCVVSSESSSSLTEVENAQRPYTPNTVRRKRSLQLHYHIPMQEHDHEQKMEHDHRAAVPLVEPVAVLSPCKKNLEAPLAVVSDDDATFNEMMGKFDESYIYEKETDILSSDSDPTDCPTDMDTGRDAGDECDTDDLLDFDFIDTASMQEIFDQRDQMCMDNHYYVNGSPVLSQQRKASSRSRRITRTAKISGEQSLLTAAAGSAQRRRKKFHKTRKKSSEGKDNCRSPMRKSRETRSVGGTPVCLRKNLRASEKQRYCLTTPHQLSHRSSSLVFTNVKEKRFMTIAESEKALLRADFEADVKYKQLIMEAESILLSMRNSAQSIPRETPVASPRRVNPLANKRVEMIKNCEMDLPKQQQPQQQQQQQPQSSSQTQHHTTSQSKLRSSDLTEQELTAAVNKRIELLKLEIQSPPGSPKLGACSPRKTHLTNFINQNIASEPGVRKSLNSPLVQRRSLSPSVSPMLKRRLSAGPKGNLKPIPRTHHLQLSDSDQDYNCSIAIKVNDQLNQNYLQSYPETFADYNDDVRNQNVQLECHSRQPTLYNLNYCPQSEPLKRKVYKSHAAFGNNYKFGDAGEDPYHLNANQLNHQHLKVYNTGSGNDFTDNKRQQYTKLKLSSRDLNHASMTMLKTDFTTAQTSNVKVTTTTSNNTTNNTTTTATAVATVDKAALILSTIADLKRNLENQSFELNGLNET